MTPLELAAFRAWASARAKADATLLVALAAPPPPKPKPSLIVPLFVDPDRDAAQWTALRAAASKLSITVIAPGPSSGPGPTMLPGYAREIADCNAAGVRVIGYVASHYGDPLAAPQVMRDIESWYRFYPSIGGIFFDQQSKEAKHVDLYTTYFEAVRAHGGYVVSNAARLAGSTADVGYWSIAKPDVLVMYENLGAAGMPSLPTWAKALPDQAVAGIVHHAQKALMQSLVPLMRLEGFGNVYVTRDDWSGGLGDWDEFVAAATR